MPIIPAMPFDGDNLPMKAALDLVASTRTSFFLTGKAGTGKTTFIRNILANVYKHFIILAPTGIAALSAGGQTIHHYLGLQLGVLGPNDYGMTKRENIEDLRTSIDTIIIDEVSMVRCDLMDAIDRTLRRIMETTVPFGGFQMIFIGDLYQLDPVVTDMDRRLLCDLYQTDEFHFFNAKCMDYIALPKIELTKMYRQSDIKFIDILGRVREGTQECADLDTLNSRLGMCRDGDDFTVTLTSLNKDAARLNEHKLAELTGPSKMYLAKYEGDCDSIRNVIEERLELKVGARIMFLKNDSDGRWVNGTVGNVKSLAEESIGVVIEDGQYVSVEPIKWPVLKQDYSRKERRTENKEIGAIYQLPVRLAWGVTIHKSQSMTFEHLRIDMGRGAFCCGQAYVALSRARSLESISLNRKLCARDILVSPSVRSYSEDNNDNEAVTIELSIAAATDDSLREMDYDKAAQHLLHMSYDAARNGNTRQATEFLRRFFSTVVNDRQISLWPLTEENSGLASYSELYPVFLFYGGMAEQALSLIDANREKYNDIDMAYLKLRCYEVMNNDTAFSDLAEDLLVELSDHINEGLPTSGFRKILYTIAHNWRTIGIRAALKCIDSLIDDIYIYKPLYVLIRSIVQNDSGLWLYLEGKGGVMPQALTKWDNNEFMNLINGECVTEKWKQRFDPFFEHPFLKLSELLYFYLNSI